jgi:maltooligosyltrehalose trehalohydrolase
MAGGDHGWWTLDAPEAGPGTDYGFVLDGDGPFPDPRSPYQPNGVHGRSRTVRHGAFAWTDAGFDSRPLADAVIYELHVGTFSPEGTFEGAIGRLDALVELGISHVELMPVVEFPGRRGWGYDGVDLFAPHQAYGGPKGLRRLVDACHARGLAVLLDVVYNHLGPGGNYLARFGPYLTDHYRTPWGPAINFDGRGSDEVRRFVIDNARSWYLDYHLDGLRLDAVHAIHDQSAIHILEELAAELHDLAAHVGRRFVVVAESDLNDPRLVREPQRGGLGLDGQWNDDLRHALHVALTGEQDRFHAQYLGLPDLAKAFREIYVLTGRYSEYRGRRHGRPAGDLPANRFVGFLQNHDHVGNRAFGERSAALLPVDALRVAAALVILGPFVPLLFAGEEWGARTPFLYFTDHEDEGVAEATRRGRRAEFAHFHPTEGEIPDPQDLATFGRSRLDWAEREAGDHAALLDWHRQLIGFRATHPELRRGARPEVTLDAAAGWITLRTEGTTIAANLSGVPATIPRAGLGEGTAELALASASGVVLAGNRLEMAPWSAAVVVAAHGRA